MNNSTKKKIKFVLIKKTRLDEFLEYLSKNLNWNNLTKNATKEFIKKSNYEYYGMAMLDDFKIVGGILMINQGKFFLDNEFKEVVNLSNLFVDKDYRGIPSFHFLEHINKFLWKYIVTDFTPNEKTIKLLTNFKFSIAESFSYRLTIFKIIEFRNFILKYDNVLNKKYNNNHFFKQNFYSLNNLRFCFKGKNLDLKISKGYSNIGLGFLKLNIRKIRILSISEINLFRKNYLRIIFNLMFRNFSPIIYIDCLDNNLDKKNLSKSSVKNHLIRTEIGFPKKITSLGSEISISH